MTAQLTQTSEPFGTNHVAEEAPPDVIHLPRRRTVDRLLIAGGARRRLVLVSAGGLLTWGSNFAEDYVSDELTSQNIFFPDRPRSRTEGAPTSSSTPTSRSPPGGGRGLRQLHRRPPGRDRRRRHLCRLGGPQRAAQDEVQAAIDAGESDAVVADLQAKADELTAQRDSLFRGETLRGLLLSTYAWSTIGRIAGIAAIVAFVAAGVMVVLVGHGPRPPLADTVDSRPPEHHSHQASSRGRVGRPGLSSRPCAAVAKGTFGPVDGTFGPGRRTAVIRTVEA